MWTNVAVYPRPPVPDPGRTPTHTRVGLNQETNEGRQIDVGYSGTGVTVTLNPPLNQTSKATVQPVTLRDVSFTLVFEGLGMSNHGRANARSTNRTRLDM